MTYPKVGWSRASWSDCSSICRDERLHPATASIVRRSTGACWQLAMTANSDAGGQNRFHERRRRRAPPVPGMGARLVARESPQRLDSTIPSGDNEEPSEMPTLTMAVDYALARRQAGPLARHTSHNEDVHYGVEAACSPGQHHRIPRIARPEDEPEHSQIRGSEQHRESVPDALKDVPGICFR